MMRNALYLVAGLAMATTLGAIAAGPIKEVLVVNMGAGEAVPVTVVSGAPGEPVYEFVGYSDAALLGYASMLERQQTCQATFGPDARWATTEEFYSSLAPIAPPTFAFIRPTAVEIANNESRQVCAGPGNNTTAIRREGLAVQGGFPCHEVWILACAAPATN